MMASASVPYVVFKNEDVEDVKEEGVVMAAMMEELIVENGVLARANEVIAGENRQLVEENRQLKLMVFQLKQKRSVKRLKCRFC